MTKPNKEGAEKPNQGRGRPTGALNKTTAALKDAILLAAKETGQDGKGGGGLKGYLKLLATTQPKAFASLLGKVLPMTVQGTGPDGAHVFKVIERRIVKAHD